MCLGVGTAVIGLIDGIAETTASLTKIYAGALSDQLGQRKWLAVIGYGLSAFSKPFLYFANAWGWVLGVRFADRMGKGIRTAPRDALVADSIDEKQRGLAFGIHRAGDTAGAFVGLGLAALIVWLTESGAAELTRHTFQVAVLVSILPAVLAVVVLAVGAREVSGTRKTPGRLHLTLEGLDSRFKLFLFVVVLFTLGNSSDSFIVLLGQNRGLDVLQIMLMVMTFNLVYASLAGPFGSLSDRIGRRNVDHRRLDRLRPGLSGLCPLAAPAGRSGFCTVCTASTTPPPTAWHAPSSPTLCQQDRRGGAYGLYNAAIGITALPASVIAGLLWQGAGSWTGFGPSAPFLFGAVLALLAGILFWRLVR